MSRVLADFVAKLGGRRLARNNRIGGKQFLNRCCALIAVLESMLLARALKIVLQHYRHICDLWRRLNEGCLRQLSGSVATAPRGPGLTPRRHWRTKFAVMHNRSSNNVLRYGPLTEGETSEATRIYWSRRWHGGVAVICARAAAIDARNRISQLEVSGNRRGDAGCRPPRPRGKRLHRGQQSGDRVSL